MKEVEIVGGGLQDLLVYADVPALMLIVYDSGVRLILGNGSVSVEIPV